MLQMLRNRVAIAVAGTLLLGGAAWGHHSFAAEFDSKKPVSITGVISKLDWVNPHAYVYLDVKDASGATARRGGLRAAISSRLPIRAADFMSA